MTLIIRTATHERRMKLTMSFKVGETVVYPHHGAALIEAIETRIIKGEEKTYLVLRSPKVISLFECRQIT